MICENFVYENLSLKCILSSNVKMELLQNATNYCANCASAGMKVLLIYI